MVTLLAVVFFGLLLLGHPIAFTLGLTSLVLLLVEGSLPLNAVPQYMFNGLDSFPLMAIPFFIVAGEIMVETGISRRLVDFALILLGRIPGALGQVCIATCVFFAGVTGAAVADAAAVGSVLIPSMKKEGYPDTYAPALIAAASTIGPIIPPSIILVVYGIAASTSIASLLIAGIVPGLLMGLALAVTVYVQAKRHNFPRRADRLSPSVVLGSFWRALPALLMPGIIVGGIMFGVFTPTEAACVAVVYSVFLGFVTRTLSIKQIPTICLRSASVTGMVLFIIAAAKLFSILLVMYEIPVQVTNLALSLSNNVYIILFIINVLLLITGCFMEISAACIILVPILLPVVVKLGVNPIHFGIIMCVNLAIGLITPPLGPALFVTCKMGGVSIEETVKALWPFLLSLIAALLVCTYWPSLVMFMPRLFVR
jgi:tripartite ATP-independent transporter DctM subunit